jgi:histone deacetylase HOS3
MDTLATTFPTVSTRTNPTTTVFLQDACLQHKYIRTRDSSHIVERPERLRAVKIGLCAAIARLEESIPAATSGGSDDDALIEAIENLRLEQHPTAFHLPKGHPIKVVQSSAKVDMLNHPAVKFIHGDVDGDVYLEKLVDWALHSVEKITNGQSEIPSELNQGDLYSNTNSDLAQCRAAHLVDSVSNVVGCDPRSSGHRVRGG